MPFTPLELCYHSVDLTILLDFFTANQGLTVPKVARRELPTRSDHSSQGELSAQGLSGRTLVPHVNETAPGGAVYPSAAGLGIQSYTATLPILLSAKVRQRGRGRDTGESP